METQKKAMPVGVEDFRDLVTKGYHFVDKTRFIRELLDDKGVVTAIFSASPRQRQRGSWKIAG